MTNPDPNAKPVPELEASEVDASHSEWVTWPHGKDVKVVEYELAKQIEQQRDILKTEVARLRGELERVTKQFGNQASPIVTPLPFDLLKALAGWPVVCRDTREATEIQQRGEAVYGTVQGVGRSWTLEGRVNQWYQSLGDLFLAPCPPDLCPDCWGVGKRTTVEPAEPGRGKYNRCRPCNSIHNE